MNDVDERVKKIVAEQLGWLRPIKNGERLVADLGADENDVAEICIAIEQEFAIEVSDDEQEQDLSVGELIDMVNDRSR